MSARSLPGARAGNDAPARKSPASELGTPMPAMARAVYKRATRNGKRLNHLCSTRCLTGCPLPANRAHSSRIFPCTTEHVSVVRAFTRKRLASHPARDDAVLVISELAANSAAYSGGNWLLVYVTEVSTKHAAVLVTEWRGPGTPTFMDADSDSESGRGLAIVRMLSCFFHVGGSDDLRNILAVVPADPPSGDAA
jgi:anti-sigma regulatory factor (Ser/Thr protein kinase)